MGRSRRTGLGRARSSDREVGHFDPRSALLAKIRIAGEGRKWLDCFGIVTRVEQVALAPGRRDHRFGAVSELAGALSESRARRKARARSIGYSANFPECVIRVVRMQYLSSYVDSAAKGVTL